jgi:hypothetical protein
LSFDYYDSEKGVMKMALPATVFTDDSMSESEVIQILYQEIQNLRESNRIALDVFRATPGLVRNCCAEDYCNKETVCFILSELVKSLENAVKEQMNVPEDIV